MKRLYILLTIIFTGFVVNAQIVNIPDPIFKAKLLATSTTNGMARNAAGNMIKIDINDNGEIEVSETTQVASLYIVGSPVWITSLEGIRSFTNLRSLTSDMNNTAILDVSGLSQLTFLDCSATHIETLNISGCTSLTSIDCSLNSISSLDLSNAMVLQGLKVNNNPITTLDLGNHANLYTLSAQQSQLSTINLIGCVQLNNADLSQCPLISLDISGLSNLVTLHCENCTEMQTINLLGCIRLETLYAENNSIDSINLSGLNALKYLYISSNGLTSLLHSTVLPNLQKMYCSYNALQSLDLTGMTGLKELHCEENQLTSLNLAGIPNLLLLYCNTNQLTTIDFTNMRSLQGMDAYDNPFVTIDLSPCTSLYSVGLRNCPNLVQILAKNGRSISIYANDVPNLQYVCFDNGSQVISNLTPTWHINSYCSFVPGGSFYTMSGNAKFDLNNNGCDAGDPYFSNLKMSFTRGTDVAVNIPDASGNYHYEVQAGTYTIAPILENAAYFNVSPASATVTFPAQVSPFIQNFCITPNGVHPDLEIAIVPINIARPGFNSTYKIIYKNKGNQMASGAVDLTFDDSVLDFISAVPDISSQSTNHLVWNFSNLNIFETREITVTINLNSPMETPPLNGGDIVNYTAVVTVASDEVLNNNTSQLHQAVVNSFDPNDKTCIEGTVITPAMVGEYVHYVIRFENTGSAQAENIVVKDMIDITKFDIATLVPLRASHPFVTRVTQTNKVEFIFENINLPYDDANNDGYVAFKIKTLPTLALGDSFSNSADIYFDYNFPIVTETFTTTIQALAAHDFDFGAYFTVFPNPTNNELNIQTKLTIAIKSMEVYNMLGQMVIAIPNAESVAAIDVSDLKTGTYFIKVISDKGTANTKFIKN